MSVFASFAAEAADTAGEDVEELGAEVGTATDGRDERADLPLT